MMITPQEVKDYSVFTAVKNRPDALLEHDILEAVAEIRMYCGHTFDDAELYPTLPAEARLACIKLAQYFALVNGDESIVKGIKSEKLGDYSYTLADGSSLEKPVINVLLSPYITRTAGRVRFRLGGI